MEVKKIENKRVDKVEKPFPQKINIRDDNRKHLELVSQIKKGVKKNG